MASHLVGISQELRAPLNAIIGYAEVMRNQSLDPLGNPNHLEYLRDIDACARHLVSLIGDIVARAKAESDRLPLDA